MEILLIWMFFGLIGMAIGKSKGMNMAMAFIGGLLLGPLSLLMIFVSPSKKTCPQCAEKVELAALVCKHCGNKFSAESIATVTKTASSECPHCRGLIQPGATVCKHCKKQIAAALSLLFVTLLTTNANAQKATLADAEIQSAITEGAKNKNKSPSLRLWEVGALGMNLGYSIVLFTPTTWIQKQSADAAREFRQFSAQDIKPEDLEPVLRITVFPSQPDKMTDPCRSATHVVLRDESKKQVLQPASKETFVDTAKNAMGATRSCEGVVAKFPLDQVASLRGGPDKEFFVTVVGSAKESDIKIKKKHFQQLP